MTNRPKIRLSRLRDIGWTLWDPIGLLGQNEVWEGKPFANEYDAYLGQAASMLRRETPHIDVVKFLVGIEAEHMGLGYSKRAWENAQQTVEAIANAPDLWTE